MKAMPYILGALGLVSIGAGSRLAFASGCGNICVLVGKCNDSQQTPWPLDSCMGFIQQARCEVNDCYRCDGTFADPQWSCLTQHVGGAEQCQFTGEAETCGWLRSQMCEWWGAIRNCNCPVGGTIQGVCSFSECT